MKNIQKKGLAGAAAIVMSSLVLSRATGFLRSTLIPNMLPSSKETDAFFMAFRITDLMYGMLVAGAISAALIPVLTGFLVKNEEEDGWKAVGTFINVTFIAMIFISILGIIFSPQIINAIHTNFNKEKIDLTIKLTRILFPSVAFIMLAGLTNGILNSYQRFAAAAYGPALYNLGSVISLIVLSKYGVEAVAFGVMCSAALYFFFQLSFALKNLKYYKFKLYLRHSGFKRMLRLAIPSLVASSIMQINILISSSYTSSLADGSVTAYANANDVWQLPFGIFAVGVGTAILPTLSEKLALNDITSFNRIFIKGLKSVLLFTIPSAIGFIVLREPIISAIYKLSLKVDADRIRNTSNVLMFFSLALVMASTLAIINRAFYANNDTKTPLYVGVGTIILNAGLSYIFLKTTNFQAAGMSLAYSLASTLNAIILIVVLNKKIKGINLGQLAGFVFKVLFASSIMGFVLVIINLLIPVNFSSEFSLHSKIIELIYLIIELGVGVIVFFTSAIVLRVDEAVYIFDIITDRIKKYSGKLIKILKA